MGFFDTFFIMLTYTIAIAVVIACFVAPLFLMFVSPWFLLLYLVSIPLAVTIMEEVE